MAENRVEIEVELSGVDEATRKLGQFRGRLAQAGGAAQQSAERVGQAGDAAAQSGQKFGDLAGAAGNVGNVFSSVSPQLGRVAGIVGQVGTAANAAQQNLQGMGAGLGVLGVALGAATVATLAYNRAAETARQRLEAQREAAGRLAQSYDDLVTSIRRAAGQAAQARRVLSGGGSAEENAALVRQSREILQLIEQARTGNRGAIGRLAELGLISTRRPDAGQRFRQFGATLREGLGLGSSDSANVTPELLQELDTRRRITERSLERNLGLQAAGPELDITDHDPGATPDSEDRGRGGGGGGETEEQRKQRAITEQRELQEQLAAELADARQRELDAKNADMAREIEQREQMMQQIVDADKRRADERIAEERRVAEEAARIQEQKLEEEKRRLQEANEQVKTDAEAVLAPSMAMVTQSIGEVIAGAKTAEEAFLGMLKGFLEMLAQQAALEAAKEFASAIAAFARYDYAGGGQHLAAGVAWTGVAIAAGAGAVAVQPPGGGPASLGRDGQTQQGGEQTTVVNFNSPIVTASTRAELGRNVKNLVRTGESRFERR